MSSWAWTRHRSGRALLGLTLLGLCVKIQTTARAESLRANATTPPAQVGDVGSMFQAKRDLETMGIRDLVVRDVGKAADGTKSLAKPGASDEIHGARITSPTLAFLHGLCDAGGGLPKFGDAVGATMRSAGIVELRATALGQLLDADDRPGRVWICEPAKLGGRVQVRRVSELMPRRSP